MCITNLISAHNQFDGHCRFVRCDRYTHRSVRQVVNTAEISERDHVTALAREACCDTKAFTDQSARLTLSDVARLVDLPRAAVRRSLLTLAALGYVENDGRYFALSPQVLVLAQAYLSSSPVPRVADRLSWKKSASN